MFAIRRAFVLLWLDTTVEEWLLFIISWGELPSRLSKCRQVSTSGGSLSVLVRLNGCRFVGADRTDHTPTPFGEAGAVPVGGHLFEFLSDALLS